MAGSLGVWDDVEEFLLAQAALDLDDGDEVRPCLVAFKGEEPLFVAWWRPFPKGGYIDPLIELLALACPLGADRIGLSLAGRASSWDDPIPPVLPGVGDLRQRVVHLVLVDDHAGRGHREEVIAPFNRAADGTLTWDERVRPGRSEGRLTVALELLVQRRDEFAGDADVAQIRRQAQRCATLGHLLVYPPAVAARHGLDEPPAALFGADAEPPFGLRPR